VWNHGEKGETDGVGQRVARLVVFILAQGKKKAGNIPTERGRPPPLNVGGEKTGKSFGEFFHQSAAAKEAILHGCHLLEKHSHRCGGVREVATREKRYGSPAGREKWMIWN